LTDGAAPNEQILTPGTYSVTETIPTTLPQWTLIDASCVSSI